jgi:hypothetical protein
MRANISLIIFLVLYATSGMAQYNPSTLPLFFFNRQSSARAEAMGKAYTAVDGDLACIHFNPAGMAGIKQIELNTMQSPPSHYSLRKGFYSFYAGGWRLNRYLQVGLAQFMLNDGWDEQIVGQVATFYVQRNTLTLSSEPLRNWLVGVNINYLVSQLANGDKTSRPFYLDAGLIKKIPLPALRSSLSIGSSVSNINKVFVRVTSPSISKEEEMPMVWRSGFSYQWECGMAFLLDTVRVLKLLGQVEWQQLLNSPYRRAIRYGAEAQLYNLLSLRCGYYYEKVYDFGLPDANTGKLESFTYGFGLQVPLHLLTRLPVNINVDYVRLPQVPNSRFFTYPRFTSYTVRLNYTIPKRHR